MRSYVSPFSLLFCLLVTRCAGGLADSDGAADLEAAGSSEAEHVGDGRADLSSCGAASCGDVNARNILFPGDKACGGRCETPLVGADLYIPPTNGSPWGRTYKMGTTHPNTLAGYSSGRIALLRRLALVGDGQHAVLLDPSWNDGARAFTPDGPRRGEDIVREWLEQDDTRTFTLIYSIHSTGWSNYKAMQNSPVGDRVKVCFVAEVHAAVPAIRGIRNALIDPVSWDNGTCKWGGSATRSAEVGETILEPNGS